MDGINWNYWFQLKIEESAEYMELKAEETTYNVDDTTYRLFYREDNENNVERPLLL